eukprot:746901-Hanusia_phi.AAC.8
MDYTPPHGEPLCLNTHHPLASTPVYLPPWVPPHPTSPLNLTDPPPEQGATDREGKKEDPFSPMVLE